MTPRQTAQVVPEELLPDRKVYSLTGAGQEELERWLAEATAVETLPPS